jgi:tetratricopeptide (TPR) repeat protein
MCDEDQRRYRGKCLNQLGHVAFQRFREAREAHRPGKEILDLLNQALKRHLEALELLPCNAVPDLAVTHQGLSLIYGNAGDIKNAREHYDKAIGHFEQTCDLHGAAGTRLHFAIALANTGRLEDARLYAHVALRNLEGYGEGAASRRQQIQDLLALIEQALASRGG